MRIRHKLAMLLPVFIAAMVFLTVDFLYVSGDELAGAKQMNDTAEVTVEVRDRTGSQLLEIHTLTRGQGTALQSLILRGSNLRTFSESAQAGKDEKTYEIDIVLPEQQQTIHFAVLGSRLLASPDTFGGWLKIRDKDWEIAFNGILAAP